MHRDRNDGRELGDEPYIAYACRRIAEAEDDGARCAVTMPPRHLKTFIGSVCLSAARLLTRNPAEKIIIVTYSEQLARDISYRGDSQICSMVRVPTPEEENGKRVNREREYRTRIENHILALVATQGIRTRPSLGTWRATW